MSSAAATSVDVAGTAASRRAVAGSNAVEPDAVKSRRMPPSRALPRKYRHVAAVHSETRPSCLSHDAQDTPSFLGFRNLMVIVLGECRCAV